MVTDPLFLSREDFRAVTQPSGLTVSTSPVAETPPRAANLSPFRPAASPLPTVKAPRSILERTAVNSPVAGGAARVHGHIDSALNTATRPSNLGLLLGGQIFLRSLGGPQAILRAIASTPLAPAGISWRWGVPALLGVAGCQGSYSFGYDSSMGGEDGGAPVDAGQDLGPDTDGDGYGANVDCDDNDRSIHPLPASGGEVVINSSRTICPGTYRNVRIVIPSGTAGITLSGYSVILDGQSCLQSGIRMEGVTHSQVEGFTFRNYNSGTGVVSLFQSHDNTLRGMTAEVRSGTWAVHLDGSNSNLIEGWMINAHADRGIQIEDSDETTIRGNNLTRVMPFDGLAWYGLIMLDGGTGHRLENNSLDSGLNCGIALYNLTDTTIINNDIYNNDADGIMTSSVRLSRIENNSVNNNSGHALSLKNSSTQNQILNNDFTLNAMGAVLTDTSSSTGNTFSGNTPSP